VLSTLVLGVLFLKEKFPPSFYISILAALVVGAVQTVHNFYAFITKNGIFPLLPKFNRFIPKIKPLYPKKNAITHKIG
jgi:hypothetical protein